MRRRRYLKRISAGVSVGIAGLAGCGAPGEETGTGTGEGGVEETEGSPSETTIVDEETEVTTTAGDQTETTGGAGNQTGTGTGTGTAGGQGAPNEVSMITDGSDYIFNPIGLYVEPGESITWVNESGSHSSTAYAEGNSSASVTRIPEEAEAWDSGILSEQGATFSHTFEVQGTYDYFCVPHKSLGMVARLVVGEPSGIEGDPPDGPVPSEQRIVEQGVVTQEEFNP